MARRPRGRGLSRALRLPALGRLLVRNRESLPLGSFRREVRERRKPLNFVLRRALTASADQAEGLYPSANQSKVSKVAPRLRLLLILLGLAGLGLGGAAAARPLASAAAPAGSTAVGTGDQILFSRAAHDFAPTSLYLMDSNGTNVRLFVSNAGAASVSRDGQRIAFVRGGEIWAMQRDGSAQERVTTPQSGWEAGDPTWSPDGQTLYFSRSAKPYYDRSAIFSVHADGTGLRRLTEATA